MKASHIGKANEILKGSGQPVLSFFLSRTSLYDAIKNKSRRFALLLTFILATCTTDKVNVEYWIPLIHTANLFMLQPIYILLSLAYSSKCLFYPYLSCRMEYY